MVMKPLEILLKSINPTVLLNVGASARITDITDDSRRVRPGTMFVAVKGPAADGHKYIPQAIGAGASAIVCEQIPADPDPSVIWAQVDNSAVALAALADTWYGHPSRQLTLVGVTGTNGKTTIATLLYEMARLSGKRAGLLSTVENRVNDKVYPTANTTPGVLETNRLLAEMVADGCQFCAMEVSSHGLVQHRVDSLKFAGGIFTNLTRDHLDYHGTFDAYLKAKKSFFDMLPRDAFALVNIDDSRGRVMVQNTAARVATYSTRAEADFTGRLVENRIDGSLIAFNGIDVETRFVGRFNAANLLAVFGAECLLGVAPEAVALLVSRLVPVRGRFDTRSSADGVTAIVDYAHTPDALANVLSTINEVTGTRDRVITVFGAGGNRDHGKRPLMAAEASRYSRLVYITSDNPRDEEPRSIIDEVATGIADDCPAVMVIDRADAIDRAIADARPGDVVLVAGKGHEDYQEFENHRRVHFDDISHVEQALARRATNPIKEL